MHTLWPPPESLEFVTPHQREQYALATAGPVGILGGNPGVGKTFCTAQIVRAVIAADGLSQIALSAPTGKASQRINELLLEYNIHGLAATTVHRMLGVQRSGRDGRGWGFLYGRDLPLPCRYVFVDEASMLSADLCASLLAALRPGHHVLFIGDFAQLPPVGHGAPLRDMIFAGIPYGELIEPMRHEGDIVTACRDAKEGRPIRPSRWVDIENGRNLLHVECSRASEVLSQLPSLLDTCPEGIDRVWDIQIVTAVNKNSELSREALNKLLQRILNPDGLAVEGLPFRCGDKVICNTNQMLPVIECLFCNYDADHIEWNGQFYLCDECGRQWSAKDMNADFVANGEIGRVVLAEGQLLHVQFDTPARTVRVAREAMSTFDLAYAITTHKSQGSQWPIVIVVADDSHGAFMVTSYEWHRTAWSRAQKLCVTIGKLSTIHKQCRKSALKNRKTFLPELIQNLNMKGTSDAP